MQRWQNGTAYKRNPHFNAAIQKYGWDSFEHIILCKNLSFETACLYEKFYIKCFNLKDNRYGYNMTDGGEGTWGYVFTETQREKMRINNSGKSNPCFGRTGSLHPMFGLKGKDNPNFGSKRTIEQRQRISKGRKGMRFSETHLQHMRESAKHGKDSVFSRAVDMFDINMKYIRTFDCLTEAAQFVKADVSNITKCCRGKIKTSKGYIWRYKE